MSQQINLFNPIFLKQQKYFSAVTMAQALGLILAGCIAIAAYAQYRLSALQKDAAATTAQLGAAQEQLAKMNVDFAPKEKSKALESQVLAAQAETNSLHQVLNTLQNGDIGNTTGYAGYMQAFARQIFEGIWLTGFDIQGAGSEIQLRGRALQPALVPAYIDRLKREPVLQGKSFATLEMQVPVIEQDKNADTSAGKSQVQAPYIEFALRSSGMPAGDGASTGAPAK